MHESLFSITEVDLPQKSRLAEISLPCMIFRGKKKGWSPELVVIDALHSKRGTLKCTEQQLTATWHIFPDYI
jgi:hypothetical protein